MSDDVVDSYNHISEFRVAFNENSDRMLLFRLTNTSDEKILVKADELAERISQRTSEDERKYIDNLLQKKLPASLALEGNVPISADDLKKVAETNADAKRLMPEFLDTRLNNEETKFVETIQAGWDYLNKRSHMQALMEQLNPAQQQQTHREALKAAGSPDNPLYIGKLVAAQTEIADRMAMNASAQEHLITSHKPEEKLELAHLSEEAKAQASTVKKEWQQPNTPGAAALSGISPVTQKTSGASVHR